MHGTGIGIFLGKSYRLIPSQVAEDSWLFIREQGAVVEEAIDSEVEFSEKVGLHSEPSSVAEIRINERRESQED